MIGINPARSAMPGSCDVSGAPSPSGESIDPGGSGCRPICALRRYHRTNSMAISITTARPAAPPTTPPAMVPAGGVLLPPPLPPAEDVVLAGADVVVGPPSPPALAPPMVAIEVMVLASTTFDDRETDVISITVVVAGAKVLVLLESVGVVVERPGMVRSSPFGRVVVNALLLRDMVETSPSVSVAK